MKYIAQNNEKYNALGKPATVAGNVFKK